MKFIKAYCKQILAGAVAAYLLYLGIGFTRELFWARALAAAKAEYEEKIAGWQAKVDAAKAKYDALAEKSAREREAYRDQAEKDLAHSAAVFSAFKSKTAAELKEKGATIAQVLAEKEKDEIALVEAKETIVELDAGNKKILAAWAISDKEKDKAHGEALAALELKFAACQDWRAKLEAKLKPKPWSKVLQGAMIAGAFALGTAL